MGSVVTTDTNRGFNEALEEMKKVKRGPHVKIGWQGQRGLAKHPKSKVTVVDIATFNEFGTRTIPERSVLRSTIDEERRALLRLNRRLFFLMSAGKMTAFRALTILGLKIQALVKKKITDISVPPNAPSTIRIKGSSNPWIDTGLTRNAVTFKVIQSGFNVSDEGTTPKSATKNRGVRRRRRK